MLESTPFQFPWPNFAVLACCRYRLGTPSHAYAGTYRSLQARQQLAACSATSLAHQPGASAEQVQQQVLAGSAAAAAAGASAADGSAAYDMQQLQANAQFLAAQMAALHEVGVNVCCLGPHGTIADGWC
jgi:hypothetical protein